MAQLVTCRVCGKNVSSEASHCPHCGDDYITEEKKQETERKILGAKYLSEVHKVEKNYKECWREIHDYRDPNNTNGSCPVCNKLKVMKEHSYGSGYYYVFDCNCDGDDLFKMKYGAGYFEIEDKLLDILNGASIEEIYNYFKKKFK